MQHLEPHHTSVTTRAKVAIPRETSTRVSPRIARVDPITLGYNNQQATRLRRIIEEMS